MTIPHNDEHGIVIRVVHFCTRVRVHRYEVQKDIVTVLSY